MSATYERDERDMRYPGDEEKGPVRKHKRSVLGWVIGLIALAAAAAGAWFYFQPHVASSVPTQAAAPPPPGAEAPAAPQNSASLVAPAAEPQAKFPIEQAQPSSAENAAPDVLHSDPAARDALTQLIGVQRMAQLFLADDIVRRFVATVDNLPHEKAAANMRPTKPLSGAFKTSGSGDSLSLSPDNSARYTAWVQMAESLNTRALVAAYVRLYPLFQEAYKALGYPKAYFNDRLIEAIDNALAAPNIAAPIALTQPRVMFEFADTKLESLSAGQKIMLRMGSQNAARVKAKLAEVRAALTSKGLR